MMWTRGRLVLVGMGLVVACCGTGAVLAVHVGATGTPADPAVFRNGRLGFAIQLEQGRRDTGSFELTVANYGDFDGTVQLPANSTTGSIEIERSASTEFYPTGGGAPVATVLRIEAQIDATHTRGEFEFSASGHQWELESQPGLPAGASSTASHALSLMASSRWADVYAITDPALLAGTTEVLFASDLSSQTLPLTITSTGLLGLPSISSSGGVYYWSQQAQLSGHNSGGTAVRYVTTIYLDNAGGKWYLMGTDPPQLAP